MVRAEALAAESRSAEARDLASRESQSVEARNLANRDCQTEAAAPLRPRCVCA